MLGLYTPTPDGFVLRPKLPEPIGMLTKTPDGVVITTLEYLKGDARPSRIWGACRGSRPLTTGVNEVRFYLDSWPALARAPSRTLKRS